MKLILSSINYAYRAFPNELEVCLAIDPIDDKNPTYGTIKTVIKSENLKSLTLEQIETIAIAQAKELLSQ